MGGRRGEYFREQALHAKYLLKAIRGLETNDWIITYGYICKLVLVVG